MLRAAGATVSADAPDGPETYRFKTKAEAKARAAFVNEALEWIGTPFRDCADVKGRAGAVDCAMLLTRCAVDTGLVPAFDPRPYSPRAMLHSDKEQFTDFIEQRLGGKETTDPKPGDIAVWRFGKTYSHGGVLLNSMQVVHAWTRAGCVLIGRRDDPALASIAVFGSLVPRPVRYFDLWSARA